MSDSKCPLTPEQVSEEIKQFDLCHIMMMNPNPTEKVKAEIKQKERDFYEWLVKNNLPTLMRKPE